MVGDSWVSYHNPPSQQDGPPAWRQWSAFPSVPEPEGLLPSELTQLSVLFSVRVSLSEDRFPTTSVFKPRLEKVTESLWHSERETPLAAWLPSCPGTACLGDLVESWGDGSQRHPALWLALALWGQQGASLQPHRGRGAGQEGTLRWGHTCLHFMSACPPCCSLKGFCDLSSSGQSEDRQLPPT